LFDFLQPIPRVIWTALLFRDSQPITAAIYTVTNQIQLSDSGSVMLYFTVTTTNLQN